LRIAASSVVINGLSIPPDGVLAPVQIQKTRFDEVAKEEILRSSEGAIYKVTQKTTAQPLSFRIGRMSQLRRRSVMIW
jgi:hypothetical protein